MPHDKVNEDTAKCPMTLDEVDLFEPGAQNFWYDSYKILHKESPVHKIPGEGTSPDTDGFILMKYEDIAFVVGIKDYNKYAKKCSGYEVAKGTPMHVKAAYYYNHLIQKYDMSSQHELIGNGDKIRYYYVATPNRLGISSLAYKQYMPDKLKEEFPPNIELMFEKIVYSIIA